MGDVDALKAEIKAVIDRDLGVTSVIDLAGHFNDLVSALTTGNSVPSVSRTFQWP